MHINYLSRGCYYHFRDAIARYDEDALNLLRGYRHHENSDTLVSSLTDHYDSREAVTNTKKRGDAASPMRTTTANVASQDRLRTSIQRDQPTINQDLANDFNDRLSPRDDFTTPTAAEPAPI